MKRLSSLWFVIVGIGFCTSCADDDTPPISQQQLLENTWHLTEIQITDPLKEVTVDRLDKCRRQTQLVLNEKTFQSNSFQNVDAKCEETVANGEWIFSQRKISFKSPEHEEAKEYTVSQLSPTKFTLVETILGEVETEITLKTYLFTR